MSDTWISVYHASLSDETKEHVYNLFSYVGSELRCVIWTVAFGMVITTSETDYILTISILTFGVVNFIRELIFLM